MGLLTYGTGLNVGELFNYAWSWVRYLGGWAIYVLILVGVFLLGMLVVNVLIHGWKAIFGSSDEDACCPKHCRLKCKAEKEKEKKPEKAKKVGEVQAKETEQSKKEKKIKDDTTRNAKLEELKTKLKSKKAVIKKEKQKIDEFNSEKAKEMKELMVSLSEVEDARDAKKKETSKLDADIDNLESKLAKLIAEKQNLARESSKTYKQIEKLNKKKERLEKTRDIEMEAYLEEKQAIKMEIESMYNKIDDLEENDNGTLEGAAAADTAAMIKFLEQIAAEKEKDLECPICLETAIVPIFSCSESHVICSQCRPKVQRCPECRVLYKGLPRRHRFAEKTAKELEDLRQQLAVLTEKA